jgi:hypothetical protein
MSDGPDFPQGLPPEQPVQESAPEAPQTYEVGGEQVTLEELQSGYQRQQDYTRKTQEVSQFRDEYNELVQYKDFIEQVREDPSLKQHINTYYDQEQVQQQQYYEQNPLVPHVEEMAQRMEQMEQQQIASLINGQLTELRASEGDKWTEEVQENVLATAQQLGTADVKLAHDVYKARNLDSILAAERQSVLDGLAKNKGASVEPGRAVGGGSQISSDDVTSKTYSELTQLAKQRLSGN